MGGGNSKMPQFIEKKINEEQITKEINEYPVVMYTKASCGYCKLAKDLMAQEHIRFREHDLDEQRHRQGEEEAQRYLNGLIYISRYRKVPQVFICGKFIGGYTELARLREQEQLKNEVAECEDWFRE